MKSVQLIHNPGAGEQKFDRSGLVRLLKKHGYKCGYLSTKQPGWKKFNKNVDFLIIAGGDGTVRKVAKQVLKAGVPGKPAHLAVLPLGTANNIAKVLGAEGDYNDIIHTWKSGKTKSFTVGSVMNVPGENFFLESFGYGVFPYLMLEMKKLDRKKSKSPGENMNKSWELLHRIILSYNARQCNFEIDGKKYSGKFLLAEIMNTPFIGPNLHISPLSDPGDGDLELVLVPEQHKEKLAQYVYAKQNGDEEQFLFQTIRGKNIKISWEGTHVHLDDEIVKVEKGAEVSVHLRKRLLDFLVPS